MPAIQGLPLAALTRPDFPGRGQEPLAPLAVFFLTSDPGMATADGPTALLTNLLCNGVKEIPSEEGDAVVLPRTPAASVRPRTPLWRSLLLAGCLPPGAADTTQLASAQSALSTAFHEEASYLQRAAHPPAWMSLLAISDSPPCVLVQDAVVTPALEVPAPSYPVYLPDTSCTFDIASESFLSSQAEKTYIGHAWLLDTR